MRDILQSAREQRLTEWSAWQGRLLVWGAAVLAGLLVVAFAELTDRAMQGFFHWQDRWQWLPLLTLPLGGMLVVGLTRRHFAGAEGSGIPQVIAALQTDRAALRDRLLSLRVATAKILLGTVALGSGFSTGREGPSVQVSASIMYAVRRLLPAGFHFSPQQLLVAGGAAGIAAAFNTPLAGIVFAIEELSRGFEHRTSGIVLTAIVLAGLTSIAFLGNHTYFGRISVPAIGVGIVGAVLLCGLVCGVVGGFFSRLLCQAGKPWGGRLGRFRRRRPVLFAGACGLLVALLGLATHGSVYGSGYLQTQAMLEQGSALPWYYALAKMAATALSFFSGIPGGVFAPTLSIGAGIGHDLAPVVGSVAPSAVIALCMAGFLAAMTQAPITSFIIVMEMVDGHAMVISLMAVALLARLISGLISRPLYESLVHDLLRAAPEPPQAPPAER